MRSTLPTRYIHDVDSAGATDHATAKVPTKTPANVHGSRAGAGAYCRNAKRITIAAAPPAQVGARSLCVFRSGYDCAPTTKLGGAPRCGPPSRSPVPALPPEHRARHSCHMRSGLHTAAPKAQAPELRATQADLGPIVGGPSWAELGPFGSSPARRSCTPEIRRRTQQKGRPWRPPVSCPGPLAGHRAFAASDEPGFPWRGSCAGSARCLVTLQGEERIPIRGDWSKEFARRVRRRSVDASMVAAFPWSGTFRRPMPEVQR